MNKGIDKQRLSLQALLRNFKKQGEIEERIRLSLSGSSNYKHIVKLRISKDRLNRS